MTVGAGVREWGLAVDFGTTATCAVTVRRADIAADSRWWGQDVVICFEEFLSTLDECDISMTDLTVIYRVGGASRMPLVSQRLGALADGVPVRAIDDSKLVVAPGASITERSVPTPEPEGTQEDVRGERPRLLWHTAKAREERGETEAAADDYRKIAELGHPDWKSRARSPFQAIGRAFVKQSKRKALRSLFNKTTGALSVSPRCRQHIWNVSVIGPQPIGPVDSRQYVVIDDDGMKGKWWQMRDPDKGKTGPTALQRVFGSAATEEKTRR